MWWLMKCSIRLPVSVMRKVTALLSKQPKNYLNNTVCVYVLCFLISVLFSIHNSFTSDCMRLMLYICIVYMCVCISMYFFTLQSLRAYKCILKLIKKLIFFLFCLFVVFTLNHTICERVLTSSSVSQSVVANASDAPICPECWATKFRHSNTGWFWRCVCDVTGTVQFKFVGFVEMCIICPKPHTKNKI